MATTSTVTARDVLDELGHLHASPPSGDITTPPPRDAVALIARRLLTRRTPLLAQHEVEAVVSELVAEVSGFGALEALLRDPQVTEIMANGPGPVWIERRGELLRSPVVLTAAALQRSIDRMLLPLGLRLDRLSPMVDARLADGSRVHAVLPPLAVDGPYLTIRRFRSLPLTLADLASPAAVAALALAVHERSSVLVFGPTGSGKTTLLNALAASIPVAERIISIEDTAELRLPGDHVVRLECRPATAEGHGAVDLRALVRTALRMRPDRLIVGEVRGPEAFDLVQALLTGHRGGLATIHARGAVDALRRLETLVLLAGSGLSDVAVRRQIASAFDLVVGVARGVSGSRAVVHIGRVGLDHDELTVEDVFSPTAWEVHQ